MNCSIKIVTFCGIVNFKLSVTFWRTTAVKHTGFKVMYFRCIQFASFAIMRIFIMNFRKIFRFYPVKFCWNLKTKEPGFTDHMEFKTSKRSSRMRTARFCSFTGVYPTPPFTLSLGYPIPRYPSPEYSTLGCLPLGYPTPHPGYPSSWKEHGTRNQRYPTPFPCKQTDRHLWKHYLPATTVVL